MLYNILILLAFNGYTEDIAFDHYYENNRMEISFSKVDKQGQQVVVGNIVNKKDRKGFPGMHIYFKKGTYGTVSDIDGNFEIKIPDDKTKLHFDFIKQRNVVLNLTEY